MRRVFVGVGSNVGDRWRHLRDAVGSLPDVVAVSPVYETDPVGGPSGQNSYLNCVVELSTAFTPRQLLGICHRLESAAGRVRTERWGPRTVDLDILLFEKTEICDEDLQIPHPRLRERRFVLEPLRDLAPELVTEDLDRLGRGVRLAGSI